MAGATERSLHRGSELQDQCPEEIRLADMQKNWQNIGRAAHRGALRQISGRQRSGGTVLQEPPPTGRSLGGGCPLAWGKIPPQT
eukprot:CAMPEP_0118983074 /NCGR_PEP_ID=MMETSP1173-20130426/34475_1 /TAXON_ID=1034831 /ORGANISM="Rhizochromulina marina cf, Strain CCMP1243" /LENGTH=83 /DNA_ID=CAMNT_0006933617 /DNA_START=208 /DNA_END=459 /DNA_ORIENTATION=+